MLWKCKDHSVTAQENRKTFIHHNAAAISCLWNGNTVVKDTLRKETFSPGKKILQTIFDPVKNTLVFDKGK